MRKQCLFDPNHLIDENGLAKHLLNCQSRLKKDWRKCRFEDSHWYLYKQIDFHQKYECQFNPLCIQNPKQFYQRRQQEIRRRQSMSMQKNTSKMESVLSELKDHTHLPAESNIQLTLKPYSQDINFGEISMIQMNQNIGGGKQSISMPIYQKKNSQNRSNLDNQEAVSFEQSNKSNKSSSIIEQNKSTSQRSVNLLSSKDQQMFEKGILKQQKKLWQQPNFEQFESKFRIKWLMKIQNETQKKYKIQEDDKDESFQEEDEIQISINSLHNKFDELDF